MVLRCTTTTREVVRLAAIVTAVLLLQEGPSKAALTEGCVVAVLNRTARVQQDGGYVLPNVPANIGRVRARASCVAAGATTSGDSDFLALAPTLSAVRIPEIVFANSNPVPRSLGIAPSTAVLSAVAATVQLAVTATFSEANPVDFTSQSAGTTYTTSNPAIATVSPDGLVTAVSSGTVLISAMNEGALGIIRIRVILTGDTTPTATAFPTTSSWPTASTPTTRSTASKTPTATGSPTSRS